LGFEKSEPDAIYRAVDGESVSMKAMVEVPSRGQNVRTSILTDATLLWRD
jgi:uncharacterized protein with GYD domain